MENKICVKVEMDPTCRQPQVIIKTNQESPLVRRMKCAIERCVFDDYPQLTVYNKDEVFLLEQWAITRVYTQNRKLVVCTEEGIYESRMSLRGIEEILNAEDFVRISRFEIINLKKVLAFDLSMTGTIKVRFDDGSETWVARRYVRAIQEKLRLQRGGER